MSKLSEAIRELQQSKLTGDKQHMHNVMMSVLGKIDKQTIPGDYSGIFHYRQNLKNKYRNHNGDLSGIDTEIGGLATTLETIRINQKLGGRHRSKKTRKTKKSRRYTRRR
jgi:hypothetical protein